MCDVFYDDNINFIFKIPIYFVLECVAKNSLFEYSTCYMSKNICTETMLKLSNTLALEYCVNYFVTIDDLYNGANCKCIFLWLLRYDFLKDKTLTSVLERK